MFKFLKKLYIRFKEKELKKKFYQFAEIGDFFETEYGAQILNESGDKYKIKIGHHVRIIGRLICKNTGSIEIGNYSTIQDETVIGSLEKIKIGNYVGIASNTVIIDNNTHSINPADRIKHRIRVAPGGEGYPGLGNGWELSESKPIIIEDNVWIGSYSVILKGVTIGEGSIVARNSVVTKNVPPYTIVAGNPAKVVKNIEHS